MEVKNNTTRWIVAIVAVVLGLCLIAMLCGVAALGGYLIARQQFAERIEQRAPESPVFPVLPEFEDILPTPETPGIPEMPAIPLPEFLQDLNGALVQEVVAGSPADEAGLQPGDLITAVDGEPITPEESLADLIGGYAPGDEVIVTFIRLGEPEPEEQDVAVVLEQNPDDAARPYLGVRYAPFFLGEDLPNP